MHDNIDEIFSDWEKKIIQLTEQITELQTQILNYEVAIDEKEKQIIRLTTENVTLKNQLQIQQINVPPPRLNPPPRTQPIYAQSVNTTESTNEESSFRKRQCPSCGAMGFAIKEMDDRTRIISYVPRRIYAKKRVCTKCRYEF